MGIKKKQVEEKKTSQEEKSSSTKRQKGEKFLASKSIFSPGILCLEHPFWMRKAGFKR